MCMQAIIVNSLGHKKSGTVMNVGEVCVLAGDIRDKRG